MRNHYEFVWRGDSEWGISKDVWFPTKVFVGKMELI